MKTIHSRTDFAKHRLTLIISLSLVNFLTAQASAKDMSQNLKDSIVYLQTAYYGYEQYQPWKNMELSEGFATGTAVDDNKVITIASSVANAAFIQVKRANRSDFIPAKITIVDYESNLALIELDANSLGKPLKAVKFSEAYKKGAALSFYWLSADGQMYNGRGFLDRATITNASICYSKMLTFVAAGISEATNLGQLYCLNDKPIGIASLSGKEKEGDIIPAKVINRFLKDAQGKTYSGIAMKGFDTSNLLDPAMRHYLKIPDSMQDGVYVSQVYTIGTGSDVLKQGDVLLGIDGYSINPYGKYTDPKFGALLFDYLITDKTTGDKITFELWRDGKRQTFDAKTKRFNAADMLVPLYEFDRQPQYIIIGGCILQKLTKSYMMARGDEWEGKVEPHLYNYLQNEAFNPTDERKDIVVLSYCLPANINIGYQSLSQQVIDKINGMKIRKMQDIPKALQLNPESKFDVIEFEMENPTIVLDRSQYETANALISKTY